jgi:hypothetical protein
VSFLGTLSIKREVIDFISKDVRVMYREIMEVKRMMNEIRGW